MLNHVLDLALWSNIAALSGGAAAVVNLLDNATPTMTGATYNSGTHTITATSASDFSAWSGILTPSTTYTFTANYTMSSGVGLHIRDNLTSGEIIWTSPTLSSSGTINVTITTGSAVGSTEFNLQADGALFTGTISSMVVHV